MRAEGKFSCFFMQFIRAVFTVYRWEPEACTRTAGRRILSKKILDLFIKILSPENIVEAETSSECPPEITAKKYLIKFNVENSL